MVHWIIGVSVAVVALYLAIRVLSFLLVFPSLLWEKRFIRFLAPATADERSLISDYMEEARPLALARGFKFVNTYKPDRGPWRAVLLDLWLSEDARTAVIVGTGYMFGSEYKRTAFYSILSDGRRLVTSDNFDEGDPLQLIDNLIRPDLGFDGLYETHLGRLNKARQGVERFSGTDPMGTLEEAERRYVRRLVDAGLARFRDLTKNCWSYTFRGACDVYYKANPEQLAEFKAGEKARLDQMTE